MIIKYINEKEQKLNLKEIDINNFNSLSQIYSFTTENIAGYFEYLDFTNKNILTVADFWRSYYKCFLQWC